MKTKVCELNKCAVHPPQLLLWDQGRGCPLTDMGKGRRVPGAVLQRGRSEGSRLAYSGKLLELSKECGFMIMGDVQGI